MSKFKKIIISFFILCLIVVGYFAYSFLNTKGPASLYAYIPEDFTAVVSANNNNEMVNFQKKIDELVLQSDDSELKKSYLENKGDSELINKIINKTIVVYTGNKNNFHNLSPEETVNELFNNIEVYINTKFSEKAFDLAIKNLKPNDSVKFEKISKNRYKISFKSKPNVPTFNFFTEFIDGNIIATNSIKNLDKILSRTKATTNSSEIKKFIPLSDNNYFASLFNIDYEELNITGDITLNLKNNIFTTVLNVYNSKISELVKPMLDIPTTNKNIKLEQNIIYVSMIPSFFSQMIEMQYPFVRLTMQDEFNGSDVQIEPSQIMYGNLTLSENYSAEFKGFINDNSIKIINTTSENAVLDIFKDILKNAPYYK